MRFFFDKETIARVNRMIEDGQEELKSNCITGSDQNIEWYRGAWVALANIKETLRLAVEESEREESEADKVESVRRSLGVLTRAWNSGSVVDEA